jgi:hypothetical protein
MLLFLFLFLLVNYGHEAKDLQHKMSAFGTKQTLKKRQLYRLAARGF